MARAAKPKLTPGEPAATPAAAVDALDRLYQEARARLRADVARHIADPSWRPSASARAAGAYAYPELRVAFEPDGPVEAASLAFGKLTQPGLYAASITQPEFFRAYLVEQLSLLMERYPVAVSVGPSAKEIAYPYALEGPDDDLLRAADPHVLADVFPAPDLGHIGDEVADGDWIAPPGAARPLSLFTGPRVDYSLNRLNHYTGTPFDQFQDFVLFTNYHRYVDAFVRLAADAIQNPPDDAPSPYVGIAAPGVFLPAAEVDERAAETVNASQDLKRRQMPAYHLMAEGRGGVTLVNIGVGPSNAKTMTDHLAVLRPQCWLMIGHCGGLRHSQKLGDYVLAHAYLRRDRVLDEYVPLDVPIPAIAEIQVALQEAAGAVTGEPREALKQRLRTGTVVTDADRNWELRSTQEWKRFNAARAVAIDMESATIAANGYRFRVPYGTLLCVSDKPLHGEPKLPGWANAFYERAVEQHLKIGMEAIDHIRRYDLRRNDSAGFHSRKLRAIDEPPFR